VRYLEEKQTPRMGTLAARQSQASGRQPHAETLWPVRAACQKSAKANDKYVLCVTSQASPLE
jgi:hypothetical protein